MRKLFSSIIAFFKRLRDKQPVVFINFIPVALLFFAVSVSISLVLLIATRMSNENLRTSFINIAVIAGNYFMLILLLVPVLLGVLNILYNVKHKIYKFLDNALYIFGASTALLVAFSFNMYLYGGLTGMTWDNFIQTAAGVVYVYAPATIIIFIVAKVILVFEKRIRQPYSKKKK